jgi:hypothetical protein
MKTSLIASILFAILSMSGCKKDNTVPLISNDEGNLITNPGFENSGQPSFEGWTGNNFTLVNDIPENGGEWALQLEPAWLPGEGYAEIYIDGQSGNCIFSLTCFTKSNDWPGEIIARKRDKNGTITDLESISFNNPVWTIESMTVNVTLQPTDQLIIHFSAGGTEVASGKILFDNIFLQRQQIIPD